MEKILLIAGRVRRVAIITVGLHPCAAYLARRLRDSGVEIAIFTQPDYRVRVGSRRYLARLLRRRGWLVFLDNAILWLAVGLSARLRRLLRRNAATHSLPPSLQIDPSIRQQPWLSIENVTDINSPGDQDRLRSFAPDLVVLAGAPILSQSTIAIARVACLNPHCGITPGYAGNDPQMWAILERRFDAIGFTIHAVEPTVDGGPVVYQERVAWNPSESIQLTWPLLAQRMYDKLADIVLGLIRGEAFEAKPQSGVRPRPPAGFIVQRLAELQRRRYARSLRNRA